MRTLAKQTFGSTLCRQYLMSWTSSVLCSEHVSKGSWLRQWIRALHRVSCRCMHLGCNQSATLQKQEQEEGDEGCAETAGQMVTHEICTAYDVDSGLDLSLCACLRSTQTSAGELLVGCLQFGHLHLLTLQASLDLVPLADKVLQRVPQRSDGSDYVTQSGYGQTFGTAKGDWQWNCLCGSCIPERLL